jgi:thiamine pyrophosphokinase
LQADLHTIIGDLDSLKPSVRSYFEAANPSLNVLHVPDQYSTDFTKAVHHVRTARDGTPIDIVTMGGLGGRVDQGLSQLHHLYMFQTSPTYSEGRFYLVSGESLTFLLKAGHHRIHVRETAMRHAQEEVFDKYAGIIPIKEPSIITLKGFEWDVQDWPTELGGQVSTSNHVLPESDVVEVTTNKDVLFTIALQRRGDKE